MNIMHVSVIAATLSLGLSACQVLPQRATTEAPASLQAPEGQKFMFELAAKGVQRYTCKGLANNGGFAWTFVAPQADLYQVSGAKTGDHGAGPYWAMADGGRIVGEVVAKADAPDANAIPWLLLKVKSNAGSGAFANVKSVQRVATTLGKAPATGCDATTEGSEIQVPYTASYNFLG
ncbi:DUF3455 domain-containing protein [Undibacterium squillarum]|uniref:DUF3455 domain-containing protein n=1 Tax=Undibacterium squillarum TaxID=1131567 RepID=A0ABQ2XST7_9BURK|nr:DUF3455 domain-containing protein [Undibacterium squillarum]GGX32542.1 hypothetical protein GCM10010946_07200 [Undibacterium squillarum]